MGVTRCRLGAFLTGVALAGIAVVGHCDAPELTWQAPVRVASGDAFRGPWKMNDSVFDYVDDPTVAVLDGADTAVAWVNQSRKDILFQRFGPNGEPQLEQPVNVSTSPDVFSWLPRMAVAPGEPDTLYVLWQEIVFSGGSHGGEIFFARSTDGGRSFSEPINLSNTEAGAGKGRLTEDYWHNGSLDLAVGPDGTLYAAWTEYQGPLRLARSTNGGRRFTSPRLIAGGGDELPARGPSLAVGADDVVHLAWTVGGDPQADIRYARSTDGGKHFSKPILVGDGPGHADAPKLALDDDDTLHVVYAHSPDGPRGPYGVAYTHRAASADGFDTPRRITGEDLPAGYDGAAFPYLALAEPDKLYVAFELFRDSTRQRPRGLGLKISRDGGDSFTDTVVVPGTSEPDDAVNGSQQGLLMRKLAIGPKGAVALVNSTFSRGDFSRIWLYRAETRSPESGDH